MMMRFERDKLQEILVALDSVIGRMHEFENDHKAQLDRVHPKYSQSAMNLVHYLAMRSFNMNIFQDKLEEIGLPFNLESHNNILFGMLNLRAVIYSLMELELADEEHECVNNKKVKEILKENHQAVFESICVIEQYEMENGSPLFDALP